MPKNAEPLDDLGHHGRRSRVIWHPGSIAPYSSLWITIQRFVMLNQPSRAAFAQDFLWRKASNGAASAHTSPRQSINDYQTVSDQNPIRLARFARVLKESSTTFHGCHIGNFPSMVRPYFGDFAVCPNCLEEGFHSVLYSFQGIQRCPAHGTRLESLQSCSTIPSELFTNAVLSPLSGCQHLQKILSFSVARIPMAHTQRDHMLGEIANWLMDVHSRCWLGQHGVQQVPPFGEFTRRLAGLKTILKLPDAVPNGVDTHEAWPTDSTTTEIVRLGAAKVRKGDLLDIDDRRAARHQTDLNIYNRTIWGDFKAIRRHLKHCDLGKRGRHWLTLLSKATSATDVNTLLDHGGAQARTAWLLLKWSRHINERDFNHKVGLHTRPLRFAVDGDIPLWVVNIRTDQTSQGAQDIVHLWIARWISAAGLLAFWRSICAAAKEVSSANISVMERSLLATRRELPWCLGISASDELILCLDHAT